MNEQIRKLALQVDLIRYPSDGINIKIEKFAELIVRECCDRLLNDSDLTDIRTRRCVSSIQQYFGVEE